VVNNLSSVDAQDKAEIGILLCQILGHVDLEMFHVYSCPWPLIKFINRENMELIATLLADKECIDKIDNEDMWAWIQTCITTPAQVFVPLAREAARMWLVESKHHDDYMEAILDVVILFQGGNTKSKPESPSVETVLATARWAQLEEDACWCEQVGSCLYYLKHYDAAIEYMESALKLQPFRWTAKKNLAELYGSQGRLDDAIRLLKECESRYEELKLENKGRDKTDPEFVPDGDVVKVRYSLGISYARQQDCENALHWLSHACLDVDHRGTFYILKALSAALRILISLPEPNYKGIMQLIKSLDKRDFFGTPFLYECFEDNLNNAHFYSTLAVAAKETDELQWLESKYKAVARYERGDVTVMCLEESLAYLYYKFLNEKEKALLIWNRLMTKRRSPSAVQYDDFVACKNRVCSENSFHLFSKALSTKEELQLAVIQELEKFCMYAMPSLSGTEALLDNLSAAYMGVWHRIHSRETHARDYFKPYIKQALQMLSDDSPYNDMHAHTSLGRVLAMAGDNDDAIAALQFVHTKFPTRDDTSTSEEQHMASPWLVYVEDDVLWNCDICLRAWGNFIHSNICCYCGATLCQACLNNIKMESIPTHACDPNHQWLNIPAPTALPGENKIIRGGEVLSTDEFISQLERAWA
jgi:tetratricopeptide (TPR) repeat protein